jgi:hypothetical protein
MTSVDYRSFYGAVGDRQQAVRWWGGRAASVTGGGWVVGGIGGVKAESHAEEEDRQVM